MTTLFARALSSMFNRLGVPALYQPQQGTPLTVHVILRQPDDVIGIGTSTWHAATVLIDIRILDVAQPRAGDTIVIATRIYQLQGEPKRDTHHLLWTIEAFAL